jgi:hypothetical protein
MLKRRSLWRETVSVGGTTAALLAALTMAAVPALAQGDCLSPLTSIQDARNNLITSSQNQQNTLATDRRNAMRDCTDQAKPNNPNPGVDSCLQAVNGIYDPAFTKLTEELRFDQGSE